MTSLVLSSEDEDDGGSGETIPRDRPRIRKILGEAEKVLEVAEHDLEVAREGLQAHRAVKVSIAGCF